MAAPDGSGPPAPSEYVPPADSVEEFIKRELDPEDERIDVGVVIVGGGTAGLACANRLLQLLGEDAATMERLGRESGAFDLYIRTDSQWITKQPPPLPARPAGCPREYSPWRQGSFPKSKRPHHADRARCG